jgi:DeoR/GlpR family transcriptional regulator of sugar metabolism
MQRFLSSYGVSGGRLTAVPPALRRARILERIQRDGGVSVAELARAYSVAPITAHRDLERLAAEGLVERVHGGARALGGGDGASTIPTAWTQRTEQAGAAKAAIAAHAVRYVDHGATVFLDASSTVLALARRLAHDPPHEVTVVTNSPAIAYEIEASPMHIIVCPGELDQHLRMLAGRWTVEFLSELNFDVAFVSAAGLTLDQGLTTSRRPLADVVNAARASAERTIGLVDATKYGRASLLSIVRAQELDAIVTDAALERHVARDYEVAGVRLEITDSEEGR